MIPYFERLGQRIEGEWLRRSYDEKAFPQLVQAALAAEPPAAAVRPEDIVAWTFDPVRTLHQPSPRHLFGEPPILLYQAPRFYIEALFWMSGTTEIHEHSFSGVFAVLAGASLHSHWRFALERKINSRLSRGRLERVSSEILRPGSLRAILSGDRLIHQLFHLELPSVTLVIRTYEDRDHLPQRRYLPPGLALDSDAHDATRLRRLMLLDSMARGYLGGLREHALQWIEMGDLEAIFSMMSLLSERRIAAEVMEDLWSDARARHGDIVDLFRQACAWERRTRLIVALRSKVIHPEGRFLLALLMLMPDREAIFEAVRLQSPAAEPLDAIESWLGEISGRELIGFDFDAINRLIFRGLVEGLDVDGLLRSLNQEFRADSLAAHRDRVLDQARRMAASVLLRPLFTGSPFAESAVRAA